MLSKLEWNYHLSRIIEKETTILGTNKGNPTEEVEEKLGTSTSPQNFPPRDEKEPKTPEEIASRKKVPLFKGFGEKNKKIEIKD